MAFEGTKQILSARYMQKLKERSPAYQLEQELRKRAMEMEEEELKLARKRFQEEREQFEKQLKLERELAEERNKTLLEQERIRNTGRIREGIGGMPYADAEEVLSNAFYERTGMLPTEVLSKFPGFPVEFMDAYNAELGRLEEGQTSVAGALTKLLQTYRTMVGEYKQSLPRKSESETEKETKGESFFKKAYESVIDFLNVTPEEREEYKRRRQLRDKIETIPPGGSIAPYGPGVMNYPDLQGLTSELERRNMLRQQFMKSFQESRETPFYKDVLEFLKSRHQRNVER